MPKISSITFAVVVAAALPMPGHASAESAADITTLCTVTGVVARKIMTLRQNDVSMSTLMAKIDGLDAVDGIKRVGRELVMAAYKQPDFEVDENQREAIESFGNDAESACYSAWKGEQQ